jgi:CheY-like chemotaxis protein
MPTRILLVDDDIVLRKSLGRLLAESGYEAADVENGRAAIAHMIRQQVDLVMTEMLLPEMDGVETILAIRHQFPWVKIIAVAGSGISPAESCLKIARQLGAHKTMAKPFHAEEFLGTVRELVG